jgi:hypothetical protein
MSQADYKVVQPNDIICSPAVKGRSLFSYVWWCIDMEPVFCVGEWVGVYVLLKKPYSYTMK